jgi:hypothetical protein
MGGLDVDQLHVGRHLPLVVMPALLARRPNGFVSSQQRQSERRMKLGHLGVRSQLAR